MPRLLILVALLWTAAAAERRVVAIAHRGEHLRHAENTMPAYAEAIRLGADFIEVDVRTTADGKLVLSHDATVDRRTNGHGEVAKMTSDEIEKLDAGGGARIPTFDEALELARGRIGVYVDVKQATARDLVAHIEAHGMAESVVVYTGRIARDIRDLNPKLRIMPEAGSAENARRVIAELGPRVIAFDAHDFTGEIIAIAKAAGAEIYVDRLGAADHAESWQAAIDAGADGIQTDHPGELVEYLRRRGYKR